MNRNDPTFTCVKVTLFVLLSFDFVINIINLKPNIEKFADDMTVVIGCFVVIFAINIMGLVGIARDKSMLIVTYGILDLLLLVLAVLLSDDYFSEFEIALNITLIVLSFYVAHIIEVLGSNVDRSPGSIRSHHRCEDPGATEYEAV